MPTRRRKAKKSIFGMVPVKKVVTNLKKTVAKLNKVYEADDGQLDVSSGFTVSNTPTAEILSATAQGDDRNTRSGNATVLKRLKHRTLLSSNGAAFCYVRIIYFQAKDANATLPTIAQLLQTATNVTSDYAPDTVKDFRILSDKLHSVQPNTLGSPINKAWEGTLKLRGTNTYTGAASNTYDRNHIFRIVLASSADAVFTSWTRCHYSR